MSEDKKSVPASPASPPRAPRSIDLPRTAIKDLTAKDTAGEDAAGKEPAGKTAPEKPADPAAASAASTGPAKAAEPVKAEQASEAVPKAAEAASSVKSSATTPATSEPEKPAAAPKPDAPAPDVAAKPEKSGGRVAPVMAGAVAGGIFGIIAAVAYATLQAPPVTTADPRVARVEATVAGLEKKVAGLSAPSDALAPALKALETRAAALEQKAGASPAGLDDRLKALDGKLEQAREQVTSASRKLELIEKSSAQPVAAGAPGTAAEAPRVDLAPIASRIVDIEKSLGDAAAKLAAGVSATTAIDSRISAIEGNVTALKGPRATESAAAVLAISGMLRRSLDAGEPLGDLLQALAALGVPADGLKPLAAFADKGALRPAGLAAMMADIAAKAEKPPAPEPAKDASVAEKLKSGLYGLVEVRPAGAPRMADAATAAGQARAKIASGDLEAGLALVSALPPAETARFKPVTDAIAARIAAQRAIQRLESDALSSAARKG